MDIIILGASNTGKTALANYLATKTGMATFNVDSVQIYKDLDTVTNKPDFIRQDIADDELVSFTSVDQTLDFAKYKNVVFTIYENIDESLIRKEFKGQEIESYLELIIDAKNQIPQYPTGHRQVLDDNNVVNFLFDIKKPGESYSYFEFKTDLDRISEKFRLADRILVGGTIYYAYNYLFGLENSDNYSCGNEILPLHFIQRQNDKESLITFLRENDPATLDFIDTKNPRRLERAVTFIQNTGQKYSEHYQKELKLKDNFILIVLQPENREEYYHSLDAIIDSRINVKTFEEIAFLTAKYGPEIVPWLSRLSYEYKYFLELHSHFLENKLDLRSPLSEEGHRILQTLKYKEHQYAKRQMTFLRRLERKLENHVHH